MKKVAVLILFVLSFSYGYSQNSNVRVTLLSFTGTVKLYDTAGKNKLKKILINDFDKYIGFEFDVIQKRGNMIKVKVRDLDDKYCCVGWISIFDTATYTHTYSGSDVYPLYYKPNTNSSKILEITDIDGSLVQVVDFYKDWLKIKIQFKGKTYKLWLPRKYSCQNIYNSCS